VIARVLVAEIQAGGVRCVTVALKPQAPLPLEPKQLAGGLGIVDDRRILGSPSPGAIAAAWTVLRERAGRPCDAAVLVAGDEDLAARIGEEIGLPVALLGRGPALAWAVHGDGDVLAVAIGADIEAGAVVSGALLRPAGGLELAHVVVEPLGAPCTCGRRGCLATLATHAGTERLAHERGLPPMTDSAGTGQARDSARRLGQGDAQARMVVAGAAQAVVRALDVSAQALGVPRVVLDLASRTGLDAVLRLADGRPGPRIDAVDAVSLVPVGAAAWALR
jgi:predicted NBD/HSP70 family sugar kinase